MPRPASSTAIYRPDLGVVVMEFVESAAMGFIGLTLMPIFKTIKQSAIYPVIPKEVMLKIYDVSRAPRGSYNSADWTYERGLYKTSEKGWEESVDDVERAFFDQEAPGTAELIATKRAMGIILRAQEKRIADKLFNASNFTANAVSTEWDNSSSAKPIDDVETGKLAFRGQCGMLPDALVISYHTFRWLKQCSQIVDRLKYTFPGIDLNKMTSDQLAAVFDVANVLVGGAVYDSAGENKDASITDIWSKEYAALVKISNGPELPPGIGRTFIWTADSPDNAIVEQYREEKVRGDIIRVRHDVDESLMKSYDDSGTVVSDIAGACCYLFSNISQ